MSRLTAARTRFSLARAMRSWKLRSSSMSCSTEAPAANSSSIRSTSSPSAASSSAAAFSAIHAAAWGSIRRRNSYRSWRIGSAFPSRRRAAWTVALRMSHSASGQTSVRLPCWTFTIPCIASAWTVSRGASTRAIGPLVDTDTPERESKGGEVPLEEGLRVPTERPRGRPEPVVLEHAPPDEDVLRAGVVVVDRILHLEHEHRKDLAQALVGEGGLAARLRLVHLDEQVDEVDAGDDPRRAGADAVEQVHAAVPTPDRELVAELVEPAAHLGGARLQLHEPHVRRTHADPPDELRTETHPEVRGSVLHHDGDRHRIRDPDDVVDERAVVERAAHRRRHHHAA